MPRRRYYYRRTLRPKQKWAINTVTANVAQSTGGTLNISSGAIGTIGAPVCINSSRIDSAADNLISAAQVLKTGRWKFRGVIVNPTAAVSYIFYLVYVPEGYYSAGVTDYSYVLTNTTEGNDIFFRHPEWVLAWTRRDYTSTDQSNEISLTSRLKRNLNSGDQVQIRALLFNNSQSAIALASTVPIVRGTVSYCCRAN